MFPRLLLVLLFNVLRHGLVFVVVAILTACASAVKSSAADPAHPAPASIGYLSAAEIPDSLALSPPPPEPDSLWAGLDDAIANHALTLQGTARFAQARADAEIGFPASAGHFACALGVDINAQQMPTLYHLLQRTRRDASAATRAAKQHYQRTRPFMRNGQPTCTPEYELPLRENGSYPSGHATAGWVWGLLLAELAPDRATTILQRAGNYGYSRLVCNAHWYSDVLQGQALAAATVASLHGNADFVRDLIQSRRELEKAYSRAQPPERDCVAEAAALEIPFPGVR